MKWILSFFIAFVIALTISFFWKERLDPSKKINNEKVGNYFTAFGSVAAALSIFFLYRHLKEIQIDRKAANQPDLNPAYTRFRMSFYNTFGEVKPLVVAQTIERIDLNEVPKASIELHNIGLGSAKNIRLSWQYDRQKVRDIFQNIYYCDDSGSNETEHVDFIQADSKFKVSTPLYYLTCCGAELNQDYVDTLKPVNEKLKPDLKFYLRYQDIYNNWQDKTFKVSVEAFMDHVEFKFHSE